MCSRRAWPGIRSGACLLLWEASGCKRWLQDQLPRAGCSTRGLQPLVLEGLRVGEGRCHSCLLGEKPVPTMATNNVYANDDDNNNGYFVWNLSCVPGAVLGTLQAPFHLTLTL